MKNRFLKVYMIFVLLLLLFGAAVLVVGNRALNRYEEEQERYNAERLAAVTPTNTPAPTPTQEIVIIEKNRYTVEVPASMTVAGENVTEVSRSDGKKVYAIETMSAGFEVQVTDAYGNTVGHKYGEKLETADYSLTLPDNFGISFKKSDMKVGDCLVSVTDDPQYEWCYEFADMPRLATYVFEDALAAPELDVRDNLGDEVALTWTNGAYFRDSQTSLQRIPDDAMSEETVWEYVKTWSDFMTDDLKPEGFDAYIFTDKKTGERVPYVKGMEVKGLEYRSRAPKDHGFSVLEKYLLPNSYRYNVLKEFGYGEDIKLTSRHLPDPEYTNVTITNYVAYTDTVFSTDVSFTKTIILPTLNYSKRYDSTSVRVFFIKNPDKASGREWLIADMITLQDKTEITEE